MTHVDALSRAPTAKAVKLSEISEKDDVITDSV